MGRIIDSVHSHGAQLAVVDVAGVPALRPETSEQVIQSLNLPFTSVVQFDPDLLTPHDGHYNAKGTHLVAEQLAAWLLRARLVPSGG